MGALLASNPYSHFVLSANGKPELVPEDEEVELAETEMVDNEKARKIENQDDEMVKLVANQIGDNLWLREDLIPN